MSNRTSRLAALLALTLPMLGGCAANETQVRSQGAMDLGCDPSSVSVQLTDRPYLGVTHYEAEGCGTTQSYVCRARFYSLGVPLGERTCKRAGNKPDSVISVVPSIYGGQ